MQWFDRPIPKGVKGTHGLAAYARRQGHHKPDVNDWSTMDAFKLHRCIEDVRTQTWTYNYLEKERGQLESRTGSSLEEAFSIEHRYRFRCTAQERKGACVDEEHMRWCVEDLDKKIEELRLQIEPNLPKTLKIKSMRTNKAELNALLGFEEGKGFKVLARDKEVVNGVPVEKKFYFRPTRKLFSIKKGRQYAAVRDDFTTGFKFDKIAKARAWVLENMDSKKGFKYPFEQVEVKKYSNVVCTWFDIEPEAIDETDKFEVAGPFTKIEFLDSKMSQHAVVKEHLMSLGWRPTEWNYKRDPKGGFERDARGKLIPTTPKLTEDSFDKY